MKLGRVWRWIALGLAGLSLYVILLIVFMPATYLARAVDKLNRDIGLQQASGTLWHGGALLVSKRGRETPIGRIHWDIHPWRLLGGTFVADIAFNGSGIEGRGTFEAGLQRYLLQSVNVNASAPSLSRLYPPASLIGLSGHLQITADSIELEHDAVRGKADVVWNDAASRLVSVEKIGTYRMQITGEGKHVGIAVSTVQGTLWINGKGEWRLFGDGTMRIKGGITAKPPVPATLEPMLNTIGPLQPNGERAFNFETRLTPIKIPTLRQASGTTNTEQ
ncbi:MAG TPA: type II secretion system protein N [Burkholderiales bacterium]|nr:type II secretion system protein N [Burkholderiales bacterium]